MVGISSLPAYVTKILSVTYYAHFGLSCPEWQFNGTVFRDAQLNRFSCRFGSRSEFTDNLKRLTSRHPDCRLFGDNVGSALRTATSIRPESTPRAETIRKLIPH